MLKIQQVTIFLIFLFFTSLPANAWVTIFVNQNGLIHSQISDPLKRPRCFREDKYSHKLFVYNGWQKKMAGPLKGHIFVLLNYYYSGHLAGLSPLAATVLFVNELGESHTVKGKFLPGDLSKTQLSGDEAYGRAIAEFLFKGGNAATWQVESNPQEALQILHEMGWSKVVTELKVGQPERQRTYFRVDEG